MNVRGAADLASAAWPSIGGEPCVLLPLGSTEQHGPHLPLATDTIIATAVAHGAAGRLRSPASSVLVAPAVTYGASGEHQSFPGTVSMGSEALQFVLIELIRSISTWAGRIIVVNGHGGNIPALAAAIPQMIAESHDIAWVPCVVRGGDAHAGRTESSLMLHLAPAQVDMSVASAGNAAPVRELLPAMMTGGLRAVSASGVLGDPRGASEAEGKSLLEGMVEAAGRRMALGSVDHRGCLRDPGRGGAHW